MVRHVLAVLVLAAALCPAAEGISLLPADPVAAAAAFGFGDHTKRCTATTVEVTGQGFAKAMRIAVVGKPAHDFEVNRLFVVPGTLAKDEVIELSFWARGTAEAGAKPALLAVHQLKDAPWTPALYKNIVLTGEWQHCRVAWKSVADWAAGSHRIAFFMGHVADQQIEFGPIEVKSHGQIDPATLGIPVYAPAPKK